MLEKLEALDAEHAKAVEGGGEKYVARHRERGKLTARESLDILMDTGSFVETDPFAIHRAHDFGMDRKRPPGDGVVTAPMPGTVTVVRATVGDQVEAGTPLLVVEAMKMEHVLTAPVAGTVAGLGVTAGQSVRLDERVAVVTPTAPADEQQEN